MGRGKIVPMLIAAVILLLRAGDCVPLLFADNQTKTCCTRGKCSPSQRADPCCQSSNAAPVQQFQAQEKVVIPALEDAGLLVAAVEAPAVLPALHGARLAFFDWPSHSPPGTIALVSLPLLI